MLSGLYSASTALHALELSHELIARNLAHINVPGFRRAIASFEATGTAQDSGQPGAEGPLQVGSQLQEIHFDFRQGPVQQTGRKLDLAIHGDGFFQLEGAEGTLYMRNGVFFVGDDGTLVNAEGLPVLGEGGPITVPPGSSPSDVQVGALGAIQVKGFEVGKLQLSTFAEKERLESVGTTSFQAPPDLAVQESDAKIQQGAREMSNVSSVHELVRMIAGMRQYEAAQNSLRAIGDSIHHVTDPNAP